jgi:osmotically-inducible protein OsmY
VNGGAIEPSRENRWEIRIGSPVACGDEKVGTVERVVMSPRSREVTHLVVHRGIVGHHDLVIPIDNVESADDELVRLSLRSADLAAFPSYQSSDYVRANREWEPPKGYGREAVLFALPRPVEGLRRLVEAPTGTAERADLETTSLAPTIITGTRVEALDGPVGIVDRVLLDAKTHRATHFVLRKGLLFGYDLIVPVDWAIKITPERVALDVSKEELAHLPEYRPDDELASDVEQALWDDEILRRVDFPLLRASVRDGSVTLEGYVVTSAHRRRAEEIVRQVRGVLGVDNRLIGDDDLEIAVAQALGRDERTQRHLIRVRSEHGVVHLDGEIVPAASAIASAVPGVRQVVIGPVVNA